MPKFFHRSPSFQEDQLHLSIDYVFFNHIGKMFDTSWIGCMTLNLTVFAENRTFQISMSEHIGVLLCLHRQAYIE